MARNPFLTRKEWQEVKANYGIPDKILKSGGFGEKMEKLHKAFESEGLANLTKPKVPVAEKLMDEADKLFKEWLANAKLLKGEKFKNNKRKLDGDAAKKGAIERTEYFHGLLKDLRNNCSATKDYFAGPRSKVGEMAKLLQAFKSNPGDSGALQNLYSQGLRNHFGAVFHAAITNYKGTEAVMTELKKYEELTGKWHDLQTGVEAVAKDPVRRADFLKDAEEMIKIGLEILKLTK
jgi:hypothetical protein